jgi:trehalose-6-phosphatase
VNPGESVVPARLPADPKELARAIVGDARARGGLFVFADLDRALWVGARDGRSAGLPLLVRGALMALATTPATGVVITSAHGAFELETRVNVPGLIYAGSGGREIRGPAMALGRPELDGDRGAGALWILGRWECDGRPRPAVVYLGHDETDEDAYVALRGHGHAVHVGPPAGESAASCWIHDQAAAFELLAQIAFAWSIRASRRSPCEER